MIRRALPDEGSLDWYEDMVVLVDDLYDQIETLEQSTSGGSIGIDTDGVPYIIRPTTAQ